MFVDLILPLCDVRRLVGDWSDHLLSPERLLLPDPPNRNFVKFFGEFRQRKLGGLPKWYGENYFCLGKRAIRFSQQLHFEREKNGQTVHFNTVFRRLYSFGDPCNRLEIGLKSPKHVGLKLSLTELIELLNSLFDVSVGVPKPGPDRLDHNCIHESRFQLAKLLADATRISEPFDMDEGHENLSVVPGFPLAFVEVFAPEIVHLPNDDLKIPFLRKRGLNLKYHSVDHNGRRWGLWIIVQKQRAARELARHLRMYLIRLYAEEQCLRIVLGLLAQKTIQISGEDEYTSDLFDSYFKNAERRLRFLQNSTQRRLPESTYELVARVTEQVNPGFANTLLAVLEKNRLRNSSKNAVKRYLFNKVDPFNKEVLMSEGEKWIMPKHLLSLDVLLVVATKRERDWFLEIAKKVTGRKATYDTLPDSTLFNLGSIGGAQVSMVKCPAMGSGGAGGSHSTISRVLEHVEPKSLILTGLAYGLKPESQAIGDIMIARELQDIYDARIGTSTEGTPQIRPRGKRVDAHPRLISRFEAAQARMGKFKATSVLLLSGSFLVDNPKLRNMLRETFPEAAGGEMEGYGLYSATQWKSTHWIVIKAICDFADGLKKVNKKENQDLACKNVAQFVLGAIKMAGNKF